MKPSRIRLVAVSAVVLVTTGSLGAMTVLDGGSSGHADHQPQIREELLREVQPDPDCPDAEESPIPGPGQALINVVRVVDGCLRYSGEAVPGGQLDDRLEQRRAEADVVAADRAVERRLITASEAGRPLRRDPDQWALDPRHLHGDAVRDLWPADAPEVRVAVIDTGIDDRHLDLTDQIVEKAPWGRLYEGDTADHGTHVAGTVAAADDRAGVVGLAPAARLLDVQYLESDDLRYAGGGTDIGDYVRWAVDHGAHVINMSLGGPEPSDTDLTAMLYAELHGVVVVASAGNCGDEHATNPESWWVPPGWRGDDDCGRRHEVLYPAAYDPVLGVANHDRDGERYDTSTANASVDVAAPGAGIVSSCPTDGSDTRRTCEMTGTSMAAPFVSATAALLRARHPDASPAAIRRAITRSARTPEGQPDDRRSDELGWGLLDPVAAARFLDEHPGSAQPAESPAAQRTRAAFQDGADGRLYAFDDGALHPVREGGTGGSVRSVDWSTDRSQLVAADDEQVFVWNGPGSELDREVFEAPCDHCAATFVERPSGNELIAAIGNDDVITHFDPATLGEGGTVELQLPAPDEPTVLHGDAGGRLVVAHAGSARSGGPDTLWLVDPLSGEQVARHGAEGNLDVSAVAVDATGDRIAYVGGQPGGPCGHTDEVYLLGGDDLGEVANPDLPASGLGDLKVDDLFFNGQALYATMTATEAGGGGDLCTDVGSAGLWRFAAGEGGEGGGWEQVDARPVEAVRPVEGTTREPGTGRITIADDGRGTFEPTGAPAAEALNLGADLAGLWATPTRSEVDLTDTTSPPPVTTTEPSRGGEGGAPVPTTTEAAIARFEQFLHALGEGDIDTICEIAGPAAQRAEDQGFGPCEETYGIVVDQMISPEQAAALRTATVDPSRVQTMGTDGPSSEVHIPAEAVVADVSFTEGDLGDYTLAHREGNWFIVD